MPSYVYRIIISVIYLLFAPLIGGLLDGIDRKISARMQGRKGPSIFQPLWDVSKLFTKQLLTSMQFQMLMIMSYLIFIVMTGMLFFSGCDILLCFFCLSTAAMFLVLAATCTHSPYASIGTHRELMQMMSYEPMVLLTATGFYLAQNTFQIHEIVQAKYPAIFWTPGFFVGFVFILTIKFRKSPFDLSTSHHANQEVIKGVTSEMVGREYALTTIAEWYENVFLYGVVALFFINSNPISWAVALLAVVIVFFLEILIDNTSARVKWQLMLKWAWGVTLVCGGLNLLILEIIRR